MNTYLGKQECPVQCSTRPVCDKPVPNQQTLGGQDMGPSNQPFLWEMRWEHAYVGISESLKK